MQTADLTKRIEKLEYNMICLQNKLNDIQINNLIFGPNPFREYYGPKTEPQFICNKHIDIEG